MGISTFIPGSGFIFGFVALTGSTCMHGHTAATVDISGNVRHMRSEHILPTTGSSGLLADATQDDVMLPVRKGTCRDLWSINKSFPRVLQHKSVKSLIQVCLSPELTHLLCNLAVC